jgi:hypothetical protein
MMKPFYDELKKPKVIDTIYNNFIRPTLKMIGGSDFAWNIYVGFLILLIISAINMVLGVSIIYYLIYYVSRASAVI